MSAIQFPAGRITFDPLAGSWPLIGKPSRGIGRASEAIEKSLKDMSSSSALTRATSGARPRPQTPEEVLYDALASYKIRTAAVAMHLQNDWRRGLFKQLDSLLDFEQWETEDPPPLLSSFSTFLRMLLAFQPTRRPGLGAGTDGILIAAWTAGADRLTLECLPNDQVRWSVTIVLEGDVDRAVGMTSLARLSDRLEPYRPSRWFDYADNVHPG